MLTKRQFRVLWVIGGIAVLIVTLFVIGVRFGEEREVKLGAWGVYNSPDLFADIIEDFSDATNITVNYVEKRPETYESELLNALAAGRGPDIFMVPNSWISKHSDKMQPAPLDLSTARMVEESFPQVVFSDFTSGDRVWALPLSVDTMALFYNRDLLDQAGIVFPPTTWEDFVSMVPKLVKLDNFGRLEQAAAAIGRARNINRATDLLSLLMIQSGAKVVDAEKLSADLGDPAIEALQFFTQFADPTHGSYTWSGEEHYSIDSFSEGTVAFIFNYAYQIPTIQAKAPRLNFDVAAMPQPQGAVKRVDYANYWGFAVAKASRFPKQAWQFVAFITDTPQARSYMRLSGRPPARRELIREVQNEKILGVFAKQALTATSVLQPDPQAMEDIFENMIESVNIGRSAPEEAEKDARGRINLLLEKIRQ
ncbi:MAG: extracellular solute-binding protein [Parcubacteria group bacterium]|nr:extracellular solute-binding protein [Parcubacteria group bacterium]